MVEKITNSYWLFAIVVINVILTIVDNTSTEEIFAIIQLALIMVLIGLKIALVRHRFIPKVYYFFLLLIGISTISSILYVSNAIPNLNYFS